MIKSIKKLHLKSFSFLLCIVSGILGFSQDLQLTEKSEVIKIQEDSSFVKKITITFPENELARVYPLFYDTELETVSNIQLFEKKGKRFKELKLKQIKEQEVDLDYITSKKIKSIIIPGEKEVILTYEVSCKELMYFASLPFFSYNQIDTLKYKIDVPETFNLRHNTLYRDSLAFFEMDSMKLNSSQVWNIKVVPKKVEADPLQFFGIYRNMKVPLMRTMVYTDDYKSNPSSYLNNWYYKNVQTQKGLNASIKEKIDELTIGIDDPSEIVNILYNYIRSNFKYVAIEIGMGAFIPSHVNDVYSSKQGDCKDLSNLLSEALMYKGIKSDIALAATFDHISDCDFPSLSSANHVICIAYLNNETVLLDPTDPIHLERTPVQSLQDRTIFIVNSEGGEFYKVKPFSPEQNQINYQLDLKIETDTNLINGNFDINYGGISGNFLRRIIKNESQKAFDEFNQSFFEAMLGNHKIADLALINNPEQLELTGNISISGKTFSDGNSQYVFFDFLPRLIETETRELMIEGTYLGNPFQKNVSTTIALDEKIETFEPIKHQFSQDGVSLSFEVKLSAEKVVECSYRFTVEHIFIDRNNRLGINKILESFKKIINEPIVLKQQKG